MTFDINKPFETTDGDSCELVYISKDALVCAPYLVVINKTTSSWFYKQGNEYPAYGSRQLKNIPEPAKKIEKIWIGRDDGISFVHELRDAEINILHIREKINEVIETVNQLIDKN